MNFWRLTRRRKWAETADDNRAEGYGEFVVRHHHESVHNRSKRLATFFNSASSRHVSPDQTKEVDGRCWSASGLHDNIVGAAVSHFKP